MATLNKLPLEIRWEIYRMVFKAEVVNVYRLASYDSCHDFDRKKLSGRMYTYEAPALTLVCKQVRDETQRLWQSLVQFSFPTTLSVVDVFKSWTEEQVAAIRHMLVLDSTDLHIVHSRIGNEPRPSDSPDLVHTLVSFRSLRLESLTVRGATWGVYPAYFSMYNYVTNVLGITAKLEYYEEAGTRNHRRATSSRMSSAATQFQADGLGRTRVDELEAGDLPGGVGQTNRHAVYRRVTLDRPNEAALQEKRTALLEWPVDLLAGRSLEGQARLMTGQILQQWQQVRDFWYKIELRNGEEWVWYEGPDLCHGAQPCWLASQSPTTGSRRSSRRRAQPVRYQ